MSQNLYLAIDQGGQSTRLAVFTVQGQCLCCYSAPCATQHIPQGEGEGEGEYIEQSGPDILAGIRTCLEQVAHFLGGDIALIKGAGFAGQGSSLLCWDAHTGAPLSPVISWQDVRGQAYLQRSSLSHAQVQERTGLRLSPHYGASKIRWCLEHNPEVKAALQQQRLCVGPIVSYIFWHLLASTTAGIHHYSVDPGHAQRTLLWNLTTADWDPRLLAEFAIPRALLPQCHYHNSLYGQLILQGHAIPFRAAARDQGASLFARGVPHPNSCYINLGTGAFIQRLSEHLSAPEGLLVSPLWLPEPSAAEHNKIEVASPTCYLPELEQGAPLATRAPAVYAWEATVNGAAAAIPYIKQHTGLDITPAQIQHALGIKPKGECYFLNAVGGLSAPYWRTDLQSRFSDQLTPYEKVLAWLESILFQSYVNIQKMQTLGPAHTIVISGGFSQADALCQKLADLGGITVQRSDNPDATLQGIACLAAGQPPAWSPKQHCDIFLPKANAPLQQRFAVWSNAMASWLGAAPSG